MAEKDSEATKNLTIRVPESMSKALNLKAVELEVSLQSVVFDFLAQWLKDKSGVDQANVIEIQSHRNDLGNLPPEVDQEFLRGLALLLKKPRRQFHRGAFDFLKKLVAEEYSHRGKKP